MRLRCCQTLMFHLDDIALYSSASRALLIKSQASNCRSRAVVSCVEYERSVSGRVRLGHLTYEQFSDG